MKKIFLTALLACIMCILMSNLNATTINIDKYSEGGLISAINQADDGDKIHISPGVYYGENFTNLKIDKKIAIEGNAVILDGERKNNIFKIEENGSLILINITIANAYGYSGAGIYNEGSNLNIISCKFINNTADNTGGAICNSIANNLKIIDSEFMNNQAKNSGGGAIYNDGPNVIIINCNFTNSQAFGAGAIYNYYSSGNFTILKSKFVNNKGLGINSPGGSIVNEASDDMVIDRSIFINNIANFDGGAVYNYYGDRFKVYNSEFIGNRAYNSGSAIYSDLSYYVDVINSTFSNNSILPFDERIDDVGVVFLRGGHCNIENLTIKDNNPNDVVYDEL
jgi:predicted outer membrane repeat protein